jgi:hypothetical protein
MVNSPQPSGDPGRSGSWEPHIAPWLRGVQAEIARQDSLHPAGYPATRDGTRLGIAAIEDELEEAKSAWRAERCRCGTPACTCSTWAATREELLQIAAVALRTVRSIDQHQTGSSVPTAQTAEPSGT